MTHSLVRRGARRTQVGAAIALLVVVSMMAASILNPIAQAAPPSPPSGYPVINDPSTPPHACVAGENQTGVYLADDRWVFITNCFIQWRGFEGTTISSNVIDPGDILTLTLAGGSVESNLRHQSFSWSGHPGTVVSGCTKDTNVCTVRVGTPGDSPPSTWSWNEWAGYAPIGWYRQCDFFGQSCVDDVTPGPTTHGSGMWAIRPVSPVKASFTYEKFAGESGKYVFTSTTPDVDGVPPSLDWDFGDGERGAGKFVSHVFKRPGKVVVKLKASVAGNSGTAKTTIAILPPTLSIGISLIDEATEPKIAIAAKGSSKPSRTVQLTVATDDGVGPVEDITLGKPTLTSDPEGLVDLVLPDDPAPFSLGPNAERTFNAEVIGRKNGRVTLRADVTGSTDEGEQRLTTTRRFGVGLGSNLDAELITDPSEFKMEENEDGSVKPKKIKVTLKVRNLGDTPLTNLNVPEKPDLAIQKGFVLNAPDWSKIADELPAERGLKFDTAKPLLPKELRQTSWTYELRSDVPLEFRALVMASSVESNQDLRTVPVAQIGPKRDKVLAITIEPLFKEDRGPITAGQIRTYVLELKNLSGKRKISVGPTSFLKMFGDVWIHGPRELSDSFRSPGVWAGDLDPLEAKKLLVSVQTADNGTKDITNFKLRLFSSFEVEGEDKKMRSVEPKEIVARPSTPIIADSIRNVRDPVAEGGGQARFSAGLETIGGFFGTLGIDMLTLVYNAEQYVWVDYWKDPSKLNQAVLSTGQKVFSKSQFYVSRFWWPAVGTLWLTMSPNEREVFLQDTYTALESDSKDVFHLMKLGYDGIAAPIGKEMDRMAVALALGNETQFQDATLRLGSQMVSDGVTGEGLGAVAKMTAKEVSRVFAQRMLRGLGTKLETGAVRAAAEAGLDPVSKAGVRLPNEARCVVGKGEIAYGTIHTPEEMVKAAAVRVEESQALLRLAEEENVSIVVRDRDPDSIRLLEDGISTLKPEEMKAKGLSAIDRDFFGAPESLKGQTVVFDPPAWAEVEALMKQKGIALDSELGMKILERHGDRVKEFNELLPKYKKWAKEGTFDLGFDGTLNGRPDLNFRRNAPFDIQAGGVTAEGKYVYVPQVKNNRGTWLSFTGDIDSVAILEADGSLIVDPAKRERVYRKMGLAIGDVTVYDGIAIPHPETATCTDQILRDRYLWGVREAWQYAPDGKVRFVRPVQGLSGDGFLFMRGAYYGADSAWIKLELSTLVANVQKLAEDLLKADELRRLGRLKELSALGKLEANYLAAMEDAANSVARRLGEAEPFNPLKTKKLPPLKFGADDLVYGPSAGGKLRKLANESGGKLLSDLGDKPANMTWTDFSKQVLDQSARSGRRVRFDLTNMEDVAAVIAGKSQAEKVTSAELRHICSNWSTFVNNVTFYSGGQSVKTPC